MLDHSPTKIHIKDLEGRYLLVNKTAEELFGVTDQEARGKTTHEIFPKERADAFTTHDQDVSESGEVVEHEEEWLREDGVRTFLTVKFPIRDAAGKAIAVGAIGTTSLSARRWRRSGSGWKRGSGRRRRWRRWGRYRAVNDRFQTVRFVEIAAT